MNRSYPEGKRLLLCIGTVQVTLAFPLPRIRQMKDGESRDKMSTSAGKATKAQARRMKPSAAPAMSKTTPPDCEMKAT